MRREISIWVVAVLFSAGLHGLLLLQQQGAAPSGRQKQARQTKVCLRTIAPPPRMIPETPVHQPRRPEPPAPARPVAAPQPELAQAAPALPESPPLPPRATMAAPPDGVPAVPAPVTAAPAPPPQPANAEQPGQQYLRELQAHIEAHKFYPGAARRQGLEGIIQVSLLVQNDGSIRDLEVSGGHKMLLHAAAETVRHALPLPRPPAAVRCPLHVRYGMAFALR